MAWKNSLKDKTMCAKHDSICNYRKTKTKRTIIPFHFNEKIWYGVEDQNRFPLPFVYHLLHSFKRTLGLPLKSVLTSALERMLVDAGGLIHQAWQKACYKLDDDRQPSQDGALAHCCQWLCLWLQPWSTQKVGLLHYKIYNVSALMP